LNNPDFFYTIEKPSIAVFKDRGSKFISYSFPVSDQYECKEKLAQIKKEYPKATHYCFAYRLGITGVNFRVNDDGEPSGSAGLPILGQLDSKQLTDSLIVVIRYFGGSQLGIPGLIHAYKTAAALVIGQSGIIQKPVLTGYQLHFDYPMLSDIMRMMKKYNCVITKKEILSECLFEIGIPNTSLEPLLSLFKKLKGVEFKKS
jgi:uncharacterized YigZ family protein